MVTTNMNELLSLFQVSFSVACIKYYSLYTQTGPSVLQVVSYLLCKSRTFVQCGWCWSGTSPVSSSGGSPHHLPLLNGILFNYQYSGTEENTWKTDIELLGNYCLSPSPTLETLPLQCSPAEVW